MTYLGLRAANQSHSIVTAQAGYCDYILGLYILGLNGHNNSVGFRAFRADPNLDALLTLNLPIT